MTKRAGGGVRRAPAAAPAAKRPARVTAEPAARRPARPAAAPVASVGAMSRRATSGVIATLAGVWLLLFAPVLDGRHTFVRGDAGRYTAFAEFSRARFAATGELTFWNPYVFTGLPTAGSLADPRPQWLPGPLLRAWDALTGTDAGTPLWPPLLACLGGVLSLAW